MRNAALASVVVALLLIGTKFYAWMVTDSVSLLSSLVDSSLDLIVSTINMLAIRYALMPPDEDHRFGHTSAEDVAALAQAAFIAGSAVFIVISALGRLFDPTPMEHGAIGIVVMIFSIVATLGLVMYQKYVIKRTKSTAVSADSLHYVGDLLMNGAVIAALVLSSYKNMIYADAVFAFLIAFYILYNAYKIGREAFDKLMDKAFPPEDEARIHDLVMEHPGALGYHDLKTRYAGIKAFIQLHLDLDGSQSLQEAHAIADSLEHKLERVFPGSEVIIHQDPVTPSN